MILVMWTRGVLPVREQRYKRVPARLQPERLLAVRDPARTLAGGYL
jgi:hypothetical protein